MFDILVTPTSESIYTNLTALLDPENVRVAVGISSISYIQAEIYVIANVYFWLMVAIFYSSVTTPSESIHIRPAVLLDLKNTAAILFSWAWLEIFRY